MILRLSCLAVCLLSTSTALAREAPPVDLSHVPLEAEAPEKFIPPGWKIEESAQGDLNGDGREDRVLDLVETSSVTGDRVLLVLLSQPGTWRRAAASSKVLGCADCTGTLEGQGGMVRIEKGLLVLTQIDPDTHREIVLRFRYEPPEGRFLFLDEEISGEAPGHEDVLIVSTFPLQGRKVTERVRYEERGKKRVISRRKAKIPVSRRFLEDLDMETYY